jgi:hypothetical protein
VPLPSTLLAHVDNIVMKFNKVTFRERELFKSISILIIEKHEEQHAIIRKGHTQRNELSITIM